jgi:hypothetical protein
MALTRQVIVKVFFKAAFVRGLMPILTPPPRATAGDRSFTVRCFFTPADNGFISTRHDPLTAPMFEDP